MQSCVLYKMAVGFLYTGYIGCICKYYNCLHVCEQWMYN